jgi:hypothetical protein
MVGFLWIYFELVDKNLFFFLIEHFSFLLIEFETLELHKFLESLFFYLILYFVNFDSKDYFYYFNFLYWNLLVERNFLKLV